ncbi:hypothetical protein [Rubellimicrobium mesophilum]|uniref:hypothetical protein n=1 Tax=Rubellimicrobium mesophilum TaxID=1123067 RepID=UPI0012E2AE01|nr:hypothetical protein [Rubellimicrobium mesophilum]
MLATLTGHTPPMPYRAGSLWVGKCEHRVALALKPSVLACLVLVARIWDRQSREPGKRNGDVGHVGLEVYDWMASKMTDEGYVAHAYSYMAKVLRRDRSTVVERVSVLIQDGWLRKVRRKDERGQAINAYGFSLPRAAYGLACRLYGAIPADMARDVDALLGHFPKWQIDWHQFLAHMKKVWAAEGKPVTEAAPQREVIDRDDRMDDLPVTPEPEPVKLSPIDAILASLGGPRPGRTSVLDIVFNGPPVSRLSREVKE